MANEQSTMSLGASARLKAVVKQVLRWRQDKRIMVRPINLRQRLLTMTLKRVR